jgi:hypothetical protein
MEFPAILSSLDVVFQGLDPRLEAQRDMEELIRKGTYLIFVFFPKFTNDH